MNDLPHGGGCLKVWSEPNPPLGRGLVSCDDRISVSWAKYIVYSTLFAFDQMPPQHPKNLELFGPDSRRWESWA